MTDLPQRGSYVVVDVPPLKASLLVVRGEDDEVRAFHNVCRHRGEQAGERRRARAASSP